MVEEYDYQAAMENVDSGLVSETSREHEGNLLAIGSATLEDRRVEQCIRIEDGRVEEKYDFFYQGEIFDSGDWESIHLVSLDDDGETVLVGETPRDTERIPVQDWAESYCVNLVDEITEIWEDVYERTVENK